MIRTMIRSAVLFSLAMTTSAWTGEVWAADAATAASATAGEYVTRTADCVACHSVPGGRAFTGGLKMGTPLGAIYSTNITPDKETGIGTYSLADFDRAVRGGVAKDGHRLYPAMPFPSYARMSDADIAAMYSYFMKEVPAVHQANKPSEIPAYLSLRWPLAIWDALFAGGGAFKPDPAHDAEWNRGAYLVQGPGHCGACHTPRGFAFQEKALDEHGAAFLAGAPLDGWSAVDLRGDVRTGLAGWSVDDIVAFLGKGHNRDGAAFGSMVDVVNNSTPYMTEADLKAIAVYLKSLPPTGSQPAYVYDGAASEMLRADHASGGAAVYAANCAACHGMDGKGFPPYLPRVAGNPTVMDADPSSLINITLNGSAPLVVKGAPEGYRMPQFRLQLTDAQIAEALSFIRAGWGNGAGVVTAAQVGALRHSTDPTSDQVTILRMR